MGKRYTSVPKMLADLSGAKGLKKMFVSIWEENRRLRELIEEQSQTINRLSEALIYETEKAKLAQPGGHNG